MIYQDRNEAARKPLRQILGALSWSKHSTACNMSGYKIDKLVGYRLGKAHHQNLWMSEFKIKPNRECITRAAFVLQNVGNVPTIAHHIRQKLPVVLINRNRHLKI